MKDINLEIFEQGMEALQGLIEGERSPAVELAYSEEGIKGVVAGFILGTAASGVPLLGGAAAGFAMKARRLQLKSEINAIADRIARARNGDIARARKEGLDLPETTLKEMSKAELIQSAVIGGFLSPIYGAVQGHKIEEDQIVLATKIAELKAIFAADTARANRK